MLGGINHISELDEFETGVSVGLVLHHNPARGALDNTLNNTEGEVTGLSSNSRNKSRHPIGLA